MTATMLGCSLKFWNLEYENAANQFVMQNSRVYVFQDRSREEILLLETAIKSLVGDDSLNELLEQNLIGNTVKGEAVEPIVKLEHDYESEDENEDCKNVLDEKEDSKDHEYMPGGENLADYSDLTPEELSQKRRIAHMKRVETIKNMEGEKCDLCFKEFKRRDHFVTHLEGCNPDQIETLTKKKRLYEILRGETTEEEIAIKKEVSLQKRHQTLAKMKTEKCDRCFREFKHRSNILNHLKICNPDQIHNLPPRIMRYKQRKKVEQILGQNPLGLSCSFCPRKFTFQKSLEKHEFMHKTDPDNPNLLKKGKNSNKRVNPNMMPRGHYQCDRCSSSFKMYSALERHIAAHALSSLSQTDTKMDKGEGLKTAELKDGAIMRCHKCDLAYNTLGMYSLHMKQYHEKALACEECGQRFTLPNSLVKHRLNHHTSFPKNCDDCGHFCATKEEFKDHVKIEHGEGIQENSVPCEICGKMVKNKYILKQHVKLVHDKKGGDFPCDQCGKIMKSKASLEYHSKVHSGDYAYRCDECGHGFMRFDQMLECKNTHAGIFKFNCTHCDYKSNKTKAFKNHVTIHTGHKPFFCPVCNHPSNTPTNLNNHIKKVHKITLCQAESLTKKNRFGKNMTEDEVEANKVMLMRGEKILDSKKLRNDYPGGREPQSEEKKQRKQRSQQYPHHPELSEQEHYKQEGMAERQDLSQESLDSTDISAMSSSRQESEDIDRGDELARYQARAGLDYSQRPPMFFPVNKYFL